MLPGFPDDPLHAANNLLWWRPAVVHGKLNEQKIWFVPQYIMLEPKHAQVRAGSTNGCIYLTHPGIRELLAKPVERLRPPAILGRDAVSLYAILTSAPALSLAKKLGKPPRSRHSAAVAASSVEPAPVAKVVQVRR